MRERGGGRIVNITSIGGKLGIPHLLPYSASKFAAMGFSQGLRAEVAQDGIAVTTAIPGLMRTGSPRNAIFRGKHRAEYAWFSIADSLPGLSVSADEAVATDPAAVRRGDAEVLFPFVARLAGDRRRRSPELDRRGARISPAGCCRAHRPEAPDGSGARTANPALSPSLAHQPG